MNLKNKLKRNHLELPPIQTEFKNNLLTPESFTKKIDGRTLRKTGRTEQFFTKVKPEWKAQIETIAQEKQIKIVEVLEMLLNYWKENN